MYCIPLKYLEEGGRGSSKTQWKVKGIVSQTYRVLISGFDPY